MTYVQHQPFAIQVEATEGCNLRCTFCGIHGIRGANVRSTDRFMTVSTAKRIAEAIYNDGWSSRIEFAMHGEPTLNLHLWDIIAVFRGYLRKNSLMVTSNGVPLHTLRQACGIEHVVDLFDSGLNTLAIDAYRGLPVADWLRANRDTLRERDVVMQEYPADQSGNPHQRYHGRRIVIIQDIAQATAGTHAALGNHAGAAAPEDDSARHKRCAKPFRELSFRWDGNVAICCNDWRGEYKVGSLADYGGSIDALWQSPRFMAARKRLMVERDFDPCQGCTHLSYRPGLLPDQRGVMTLPAYTDADDEAVAAALDGEPYTQPVLRPWEV